LSVGQMAEDLGVSRTTVSKYEHDATGKRGVPRMALLRYSDLSGVPLEWLLTGGFPGSDQENEASARMFELAA